jgi:hypothetical protein
MLLGLFILHEAEINPPRSDLRLPKSSPVHCSEHLYRIYMVWRWRGRKGGLAFDFTRGQTRCYVRVKLQVLGHKFVTLGKQTGI